MSYDRIVVAVDFSDGSFVAARRALELVSEQGRVRLLHVVDGESVSRCLAVGQELIDGLFQEVVRDRTEALETKALHIADGKHVETKVEVGRPADVILEGARGADLLVLGSGGKGVFGRFVDGSVAEEVARGSTVPTLVVREGAAGNRKIERILCAVDLTHPCEEALQAASELADRLGARLEAIHVVPGATLLGGSRTIAGKRIAKQAASVEARARKAAPRLVRTLISRATGRSANIHVVEGSAAPEILRYARKSDILVCSTHGRGALGRLAFGSVATKLLRAAPCPVLVVRPKDAPVPARRAAAKAR